MSWFDGALALGALSVFIAGVMRGFTGFGSALVIVPALSVLYRPVDAVVTFALLEVGAALQLARAVAPDTRWRIVVPLACAAAVCVPLGAWTLVSLDADRMRRLIAVLVIVMTAALATGWRYRGQPSTPVVLGVGTVSGVLAGAATLGGPPVILFLLSGREAAREVRASITTYFILTTLWALLLYSAFGAVRAELVLRALAFAPAYAIGMYLGTRLFSRASERLFRRGAMALLFAIGLAALLL